MPFAFIGFFLATKSYEFEWITLVYVIFCMVFARSAAMAFNRYIDRGIDTANPRTAKVREIPNGSIKANSALLFVVINSLLFIATTNLINPLCLALSPIALLVILGYSYTKRFTALCHLVLGLGLSLAPAGAFIAVTETIVPAVVFLSLSVIGWVSGFDIIYSLQDDRFDASEGLLSIPSTLGRKKALFTSRVLHIFTVLLVITAGLFFEFHFIYFIGASLFVGLLIYQQTVVKENDLSNVNLAFMTANGIASIVFFIFAIADLIAYN